MNPTSETYQELQTAYDHFNKELFDNELPGCLITLQREKKTFGYYSPKRFVNKQKAETDEIAMNPSYFSIRTIEETLSTIVHECVHQFQQHFGTPGRSRYHNKEWSDKMESIGLMPTSTGKEGGKKTGDRMSHYTIEGMLFDNSCKRLVTKNFRITWADRFPPVKEVESIATFSPAPDAVEGQEPVDKPIINSAAEEMKGWGIEVADIPPKKKSTRAKLSCPDCNTNVWGKPTLKILCVDCDALFAVTGQ